MCFDLLEYTYTLPLSCHGLVHNLGLPTSVELVFPISD